MQDKDSIIDASINFDEPCITYEELNDKFSHFEIAFLSFHQSIAIINSAVYLQPTNKKMKPKVAVVALKTLLNNYEMAVALKNSISTTLFKKNGNDSICDDYNVDDGHLGQNNG